MGLHVVVHLDEAQSGGPREAEVELDDFTCMFLDTVLEEFRNALRLDEKAHEFDYFEYTEDGDYCSVKTDEEVHSLRDSPPTVPLHVWLKSSRPQSTAIDTLVREDTSTVGELEMISAIGNGQFGTVYKAYDVRNERMVAVKCIHGDLSMSMLHQEIEVLSLARGCPQIVQFYNAVSLHNTVQILLEFMDGLSLDRYGKLPLEVLAGTTVSIADALTFLWKKHVIHRDIKPSNFLVNSQGHVKLADFGVSRLMMFSNVRSSVGTQAYLSPERVVGGDYTVASEVWSFGVSVYELAVGSLSSLVAENGPVQDVSVNIVSKTASISSELLQIDENLRLLVLACLKPSPAERVCWQDLTTTKFISSHRPVDHAVIAEFVRTSGLVPN